MGEPNIKQAWGWVWRVLLCLAAVAFVAFLLYSAPGFVNRIWLTNDGSTQTR